ncbi:MAG: GNAT family N-acetyltransferase [Alphaproteobacteria bacterium]|nr:GNAT family N-acetyltransferase [Alphaproteobacteria bacterium]
MTIRADFSPQLFHQDSSFERANEQVLYEALSYLAQLGRWASSSKAGIKWMSSGLGHPLFNYVYNVCINNEDFPLKALKIINSFKEKRTPFFWVNGPSTQPKNYRNISEKEGLNFFSSLTGMVYELQDLPDVELKSSVIEIQRVNTEKLLHQFDSVSAAALDHSPGLAYEFFKNIFISPYLTSRMELFIATQTGKPVGIGILFLGKNAAVNIWGGVMPSVRHQGILSQLALYRMRRARAYGYSQIHSSCFPPYVGLYRRLGFQECCTFDLYSYIPD